MKYYKIGSNGELILTKETKDENGSGEARRINLVEYTPLQSSEADDQRGSQIQPPENHNETNWHAELKESFRRSHPEWTEQQLEIAASGR